ncbi:carboxypeptidase-like regulatory domain-containing protein [Pseudoalteromonas rhizosphaerae]|uniref:carboxypeptidase-like regulatory domain-containing protein n=1 Tax=Pseudoalteromonas rhizosphaerae TaxID=2518973 RepID=UPI0038509A48
MNHKIKVIHRTTGTVSELTTNKSGTFIVNVLRVGGPYTVFLDSDQFTDTMLENIYLELSDTYRLNYQLQAANIEKIEVSG